MKKFVKSILIIVSISFGFAVLFHLSASKSVISSGESSGFIIESFHIDLNVSEDNKVYVKEKILTNWNEIGHHGIYQFIPKWLEYTDKNGRRVKRYSEIYDLTAYREMYELDTVNGKERIKIGDPTRYVDLGEKEYDISYIYDMGSDPYIGFDEFIFHAFGDYWVTPIDNASITVTMPKDITGCPINFYSDKYRKNSANGYVTYKVDGNKIYINVNKIIMNSLTIDIELPNGYFNGGSWNYGIISYFNVLIIIILTIYIAHMWKKHGKDLEKRAKTVEFYPPDNLNVAEIGYIYNDERKIAKGSDKGHKLCIALIIQLASKGYIKINEKDDSKIEVINMYPKPKDLPEFKDYIPQRVIEVTKLKMHFRGLTKSAQKMMKYILGIKGTTVKIDTDDKVDLFIKTGNELIRKGFIGVVSDNCKKIENEMENYLIKYESDKEKNKKELEKCEEGISKLKPLSGYEKTIYDELFKDEPVIIVSEHKTLYKAFDDVLSNLNANMVDKIHDKEGYEKKNDAKVLTVFIAALSLYNYFVIAMLAPNHHILYYLTFMCIPVCMLFTKIMERKTKYGEIIRAKILGFKDFLMKVQKYELEAFVEKNPEYFYDILPYTYVLGVSKVWIKKFENIKMPKIDMGTFDYSSDSSLSDFSNDIIAYTVSGGGSGGCSSCGGGCSSCGGGCSSCGGGGSW